MPLKLNLMVINKIQRIRISVFTDILQIQLPNFGCFLTIISEKSWKLLCFYVDFGML